jgi:hypothetical protein
MAIWSSEKGEIKCDKCGELIARITAPKQVFEVIDEWGSRSNIECRECIAKSIEPIKVIN